MVFSIVPYKMKHVSLASPIYLPTVGIPMFHREYIPSVLLVTVFLVTFDWMPLAWLSHIHK